MCGTHINLTTMGGAGVCSKLSQSEAAATHTDVTADTWYPRGAKALGGIRHGNVTQEALSRLSTTEMDYLLILYFDFM